MRHTTLALGLLAALLASCGGSTPGDQTLRVKYTSLVSFGDSLSDVGTYAVGTIKQAGGGKFTINGDLSATNAALTGKNWTELMAAQLSLPAPCPAQTGLDGDPLKGFSVPVVNHLNCLSYAQGGARVSNPVGPEHKLTGSPLGLLTVPVVTQVATHLARKGGKFSGTEVVFVTAGGNDVLALLGQLNADATAAGQAAAELAAIVKSQIVAKGANYVVVNNLPDLGGAPASKALDASSQALINSMISTFNRQLKSGLAGEARILYVDLWSVSHDQITNPAPYGLTNTSTPACASNFLGGSSLVCNGSNLVAGDVSRYMFADGVLPTPFENALIAKYVAEQMLIKGWL